ncbi:hypothetical protein LTR53_013118 [Teratosphaeriaceae sp. CCFEE 6253]|nr:hypothetical protein LTR53_013118 [Teratosphaeriaceae sp. CCFEE 6253]
MACTSSNGSSNTEALSISKTHIVPAAHGFAFEVRKGERFRVVDLYGEQVVDFAAWVQGTDLREKSSMLSVARDSQGSSLGQIYLRAIATTSLLTGAFTDSNFRTAFMSCFPEMYAKKGLKNHRSCAGNMAEVMAPYGVKGHLDVTDPFNIVGINFRGIRDTC